MGGSLLKYSSYARHRVGTSISWRGGGQCCSLRVSNLHDLVMDATVDAWNKIPDEAVPTSCESLGEAQSLITEVVVVSKNGGTKSIPSVLIF